jgi:hypothetical protein
MGHFYEVTRRDDGSTKVVPVFEMATAAGGVRSTHLGDAKKHFLLPSVTEVLGKAIRKPALERWMERQYIRAFANAPDAIRKFNTDSDEGLNQASEFYRAIRESLNQKAPEAGKEIHSMLERFYRGENVAGDPSDQSAARNISIVMRVNMHLQQLYPRMASERFECLGEQPVAGPGYAGMADLTIYFPDSRTAALVDFKCMSDTGKWEKWTRPYEEEATQVVAYARAISFMGGIAGRPVDRLLVPSILKINTEDGRIKDFRIPGPDIAKYADFFRCAQRIMAVQENWPLLATLSDTRRVDEMLGAISAARTEANESARLAAEQKREAAAAAKAAKARQVVPAAEEQEAVGVAR